jgi:hypothetical protein
MQVVYFTCIIVVLAENFVLRLKVFEFFMSIHTGQLENCSAITKSLAFFHN